MNLLREVTSLFREDASSWSNILSTASAITWQNWNRKSSNTKQLLDPIQTLSSKIVSISDRAGLSVDIVTKNAIALAASDQLNFARLTILMLFKDGILKGNAEEWLAFLPPPTPFESLLCDLIFDRFSPSAEAFNEALHFAKSEHQKTCLHNLLLCIDSFPEKTSDIIKRIEPFNAVIKVSPKIIISEIRDIVGADVLKPDLDIPALLKSPKAWRQFILADAGITKLFLTPDATQSVIAAPYSLDDTPASLLASELKTKLIGGLERGSLQTQLISSILSNKSAAEAMERNLDWSFLLNYRGQFMVQEYGTKPPSFQQFRSVTSSGRLAGNLASLVISGTPRNSWDRIKSEEAIVQKILTEADPLVLRFAIRSADSHSQAFIVNCLLKKKQEASLHQLAAEAFLSVPINENTDLSTLKSLLPLVSNLEKKDAFNAILQLEKFYKELLTTNEDFRKFYADSLSRGALAKSCAGIEQFKIYGSLGEIGAEIVEALLSHASKIPGKYSRKMILDLMVRHAPQIAGSIFEKRGIDLDSFKHLLENETFKSFPYETQFKILNLKTKRGKPALHVASRQKYISAPVAEWLSAQRKFRKLTALHAPAILNPDDISLPELIAGIVVSPNDAAATLEGFDQKRLIKSLPKALELLQEKPRVAAALELAIRSEISALPIFMRLAKRLAPPFDKKDYGRRFDDLYTTYELPKRSGGKRIISAPAVHLKIAQRALLTLLYAEGFSDQAMGFVPGRSTRDNAAKHVGKDVVVNADVKAFFPSTSYKRVYSLSRRLCDEKLSPLAARLFAEICCHDGHLATGAPTSPAVSNLIMRNLDASLNGIATKLDVTYTRYADDLTFSGKTAAVWMLRPLKSHLEKLGYELDPKKTNIFRKGRRQIVTGAVVNAKVNLALPLRKILRAAVDHRVKGKQPFFQGRPMNDAVLNGYIAYLNMLSPESAAPLISRLKGSPGWAY